MMDDPSRVPAGLACVEHSLWTPVPPDLIAPPATLEGYQLKLKEIDPDAAARVQTVQTFHLVGCSGDFSDHRPQRQVAAAMAAQAGDPQGAGSVPHSPAGPAAFLYHLGDITYKDDDKQDMAGNDQLQMYNDQFYAPYSAYRRPIFAIAGNHDGKLLDSAAHSSLPHFVANFCAATPGVSPDNHTDTRLAGSQPYLYWRLNTPLAYIIGLYTNIAHGGMLDDPRTPGASTQYAWLVAQLQEIGVSNAQRSPRKAVILACHYPPYSGTANFVQRGDPRIGPTPTPAARPLGMVLQQAYRESGQRPDLVVSAHTHLYQRLTYRAAGAGGAAWEIPHLVVGGGGHSPVETLGERCDKTRAAVPPLPFDAVFPPGLTLPPGDSVQLVAYNDRDFGFLRLTIEADSAQITGEFFAVSAQGASLADAFCLDLRRHTLQAGR